MVDFFPAFAIMLPLTVISDILGVKHEDMFVFKKWGEEMIAGNSHALDNARRREVARAVVDFHEYFEPLIEQRRQQPAEDLLSWLVNVEVDGEPGLTNAELGVIVSQILLAGHETTTNLIGTGWCCSASARTSRPDCASRPRTSPSSSRSFCAGIRRSVHDAPRDGRGDVPRAPI